MIQELGLSIKEHDKLRDNDPERYWKYFWYIYAAKKKEMNEIQKASEVRGGDLSGKTNTMEFPDDFVSSSFDQSIIDVLNEVKEK